MPPELQDPRRLSTAFRDHAPERFAREQTRHQPGMPRIQWTADAFFSTVLERLYAAHARSFLANTQNAREPRR